MGRGAFPGFTGPVTGFCERLVLVPARVFLCRLMVCGGSKTTRAPSPLRFGTRRAPTALCPRARSALGPDAGSSAHTDAPRSLFSPTGPRGRLRPLLETPQLNRVQGKAVWNQSRPRTKSV